jgi:hypothetical protein
VIEAWFSSGFTAPVVCRGCGQQQNTSNKIVCPAKFYNIHQKHQGELRIPHFKNTACYKMGYTAVG